MINESHGEGRESGKSKEFTTTTETVGLFVRLSSIGIVIPVQGGAVPQSQYFVELFISFPSVLILQPLRTPIACGETGQT